MKSVVDLFVVKDRIAIFWFTMACVSIVCCAIFVQKVVAAVKVKPQYVIMDSTGTYYLAPSVAFEHAKDLHAAQSRLALETLYNRGPEDLDYRPRMKKMFTEEAQMAIAKDILAPDEAPFREQQTRQTVEVTEAGVYKNLIDPRGMAVTIAKGKLTRKSNFKGQARTEELEVVAYFWWTINTRMADNGLFPTVCTKFKAEDPKKISSSEVPLPPEPAAPATPAASSSTSSAQ